MPFYEYECRACGHQFDTLQKISDVPLKKCPECGKNQLQKLVSAAGFQLKGSGWYVTDFKNKDKSKPTTKDTTAKEKKDDAKKSTTTKSDE